MNGPCDPTRVRTGIRFNIRVRFRIRGNGGFSPPPPPPPPPLHVCFISLMEVCQNAAPPILMSTHLLNLCVSLDAYIILFNNHLKPNVLKTQFSRK